MHSKRMYNETKVNTRVQEHEKQKERKFHQLRQTLEEENKTKLLALHELRESSETTCAMGGVRDACARCGKRSGESYAVETHPPNLSSSGNSSSSSVGGGSGGSGSSRGGGSSI